MSAENKSNNKGAVATGVFAAIAASSCCIPPVIASIAGVGGMGSTLSWMEPLRPYLIGLAVVAIGYAWYAQLKPKEAGDCGCDIEKPKWYQTKGFLIGMTLFAIISIGFPYYSGIFFPNNKANTTIFSDDNDVTEVVISIDGMTCTGCEHHVKGAIKEIHGVIESKASFEKGEAFVKYDQSKVSQEEIGKVIEDATGYKVIKNKEK